MDLIAKGLRTENLYNLALTSKVKFVNLASVYSHFLHIRRFEIYRI